MLSLSYLFEEDEDFDREDMIDHFNERTHNHIFLVEKYLDKIINLEDSNLDNSILEKEKEGHDESKFLAPEHEPYLKINWRYHMKDRGIDYNPGKKIEDQMQAATFHHVKNNKHHPEFWDEKSTIENVNNKDRDKPPEQIVDATKMQLEYIACMVADWCAMSEERNSDPYKWAKDNINVRWQFTPEQENFIYDLLDEVWKKK